MPALLGSIKLDIAVPRVHRSQLAEPLSTASTLFRSPSSLVDRRSCLHHATASNGDSPSASTSTSAAAKYGWDFASKEARSLRKPGQIMELPVNAIRRPLGRTRANDQEKVAALMQSISEIGLQEPIDVLEVEGKYYGFSGCHRYEAHVKLGKETVMCRVRKATPKDLKFHMM